MTKETQQQIKKWLKDFEKTQPHNPHNNNIRVIFDYDTFKGDAYALLSNALAEYELTRKEVITFFKVVMRGIRDEYEQGASYRKLNQDIKTLKDILN